MKIAAIGDVIMALPMINEIRKDTPNAQITWVCGKAVKPIIEQFSIDKIIVVDEKKLLAGTKIDKAVELVRLWKKIAFHCYDVIAIGHASRRYKLLTLFTRGIEKNRFSHIMGEMWPIPGRRHSDEYVRLIQTEKSTNHEESVKSAHLHIDPDYVVNEIVSMCQGKKIIVLSPGGAKNIFGR